MRHTAAVYRLWVTAAVLTTAGMALSGCDDDRASANASPEPPEAGTCRIIAPGDAFDEAHVNDSSETVPCSERHTAETVKSWEVAETTMAALDSYADSCGDQAVQYVGIDQDHWIPIWWELYLPSKSDIAAGASWVRCDLLFQTDTAGVEPPAWTTGSAAGIARHPPVERWACTDSGLEVAAELVACDRPHLYEQTGQTVVLAHATTYPTVEDLRSKAAECARRMDPAPAAGVEVGAAWDPPEAWEEGDNVYGVCWKANKDRSPLPARS